MSKSKPLLLPDKPDYSIELGLGFKRIAGIDEVGRGPWAGPVTAAAVILDPNNIPEGLNDSKKLTEKRRNILAHEIRERALVGIGDASVEEIDELNILKASHLAMLRAIEALPTLPDYALIDGNKIPAGMPCRSDALVKGDARSVSIAAASIIAKVHRDLLMCELAVRFPHYGWETNRGYGTEKHRMGLFCHGVTPHHRRSFKPIHNILCEEKTITR